MAKDVIGEKVEKPKSHRQARGGDPFMIKMLDCHPKQERKLISVQLIGDTVWAVQTYPFDVPMNNLVFVEVV